MADALTSLVIARLKAQVPALRSIEGAAAFASIMERKAWPQNTPAAYVIPSGLRGGAARAATGAFVQDVTESVSVAIVLRPNDRVGAAGLEPVDVLRRAVLTAIAGWAPDEVPGVFVLTSATLSNVTAGALVDLIAFGISDQLRIAT